MFAIAFHADFKENHLKNDKLMFVLSNKLIILPSPLFNYVQI